MGSWNRIVTLSRREFPLRFLPDGVDTLLWRNLAPIVQTFLDRKITGISGLKKWILEYAEISNAISQAGAILYIEMTTDTRNSKKSRAYRQFIEHIEPEFDKFNNTFNKKLNSHSLKKHLPAKTYGQWLQSIANQIKLFHDDNLPLNTATAKLAQRYQQLSGELSADWEGNSVTLTRLNTELQSGNRSLREKAWQKISHSRLARQKSFNNLFNRMFELRNRIAQNLGCRNYRDYCFRKYERTDYGPQDCRRFHYSVKTAVLPLYRHMLAQRSTMLNLPVLKPWDLDCDISGFGRLKLFKGPQVLKNKVKAVFKIMDPEFHVFFKTMGRLNLMDLENRFGKAPGGYQCSLDQARLPFIFMNATDSADDFFTLLHESGHAFHVFYTRNMPLAYNRGAPMEFSEVASMTMERLGLELVDKVFSVELKLRAIVSENEKILRLFIWVAIIDKFQHWLYTHPRHSDTERTRRWNDLLSEYDDGTDWSGLESTRDILWHRQLHLFELPFYYIEYGIAQLGALQLWNLYLSKPKAAVQRYKAALKQGGTLSLKQLFNKADLTFDFSKKTVFPLAEKVYGQWREALERLSRRTAP